jgi:hypothetical protein
MAAFPLPSNNPLAPDPRIGSSTKTSIPITKTTFEGNYLQVRRVSTRSRKVFKLEYPTLTTQEFKILQDFFNLYVGTVFTFTHPVELQDYQVTFSTGELDEVYTTFKTRDTSIILESV